MDYDSKIEAYEKISKFKEYLDKGVITQEEYDRIKNNILSSDTETNTLTNSTSIKENSTKPSKRLRKNVIIICSSLLCAIILTCIGLFSFWDYHYKDIQSMMPNLNYYYLSEIDTKLDYFPYGYRDIERIRSEFREISSEIATIEKRKIGNSGYYVYSNQYSENSRQAFENLYSLSDTYSEWGLSNLLSLLMDDYSSSLIYGKTWTVSTGSFLSEDYQVFTFQWSDGENGTLSTNLPSSQSNKKSYFFYYEKRDGILYFGYVNQEDENDRFDAYRIDSITYNGDSWSLRVYCYKDGKTYTLI